MAKPPKRKLPKNIAERSDKEIAERVFGKTLKKRLDQLAATPTKKG